VGMKRYFMGVVLLVLLVLPAQSQAYVSTQKTAIRINDHTFLYLISYEFGHKKYDYRLPIAAVRGNGGGDTALGYDIMTGTSTLRTNAGQSKAVVLSNAKVENGMYVVPKGTKQKFTLVAFLGIPAGYTASSTDFAVHVNNLPFELGNKGAFTHGQLSAAELAPYKTMPVGVVKSLK
jgi:hypothetical protein